jgi:6-phosphogluconolactonase
MDREIIVVPDARAVAREAANRFASQIAEAVQSRGRFSVALCGGSTPRGLYRLLADERYRGEVPWHRVHVFWGDERCVPPDDPDSNYRLAYETLLSHVPIPLENVYRIQGELKPAAAARTYDRAVVEFFCGPRPRFDLVLLGLGSDGHTASLSPGSAALDETERLAVPATAVYQDRPAERVTLTLPVINGAREVLFLVTGEEKAEIVQAVLEDPSRNLPAQRVQPVAGQLTWLLDAAAASRLQEAVEGAS